MPSFNANSVNPDQMLRSANVFRANDLICEKNNLEKKKKKKKKNGATFTNDWIHLIEFPPFYKGEHFCDLLLLSCTPNFFWKGVYSKNNQYVPSFKRRPFFRRDVKQFW